MTSITIKPLQLVDGGPVSASPTTAASSPREKPRCQSSISYVTSPTSSLSRHSSLGPSSFPKDFENPPKEANRRSTGSLPPLTAEQRPPVTLVEKHADLLHFIAQKESKCLELRSQLAVHEAELVQLKRKWQRIVSRGLEKEREDSPLSATSENLTSPVLEGIKEGVHGVSRLLAYGLASAAPPTPPSSLYSAPPLKSKKRTYQSSTSSVSTFSTTQSNSETSFSSYDEKTDEASPDTEHEESVDGEKSRPKEREILMVRDTGASPLVSPNPEFIQQKKRSERDKQHARKSVEYAVPVLDSIDDARDTLRARRKAKDGDNARPLLLSSQSSPAISSTASSEPSPSLPSDSTPNVLSPLDYSEFTPAASLGPVESSKKKGSNRVSLPPIGSMPGIALATMVNSPASQAVSSWVGSVVGKKWEDTISKNQKRASVLLSDVSQSIAQALTSPGSPSQSPFSSNASLPSTGKTKARISPPPSRISTPADEDVAKTPRVIETRTGRRQQQKTPPPVAEPAEDEWNW